MPLPPIQYLFPGHGSERPDMARRLYEGIETFRKDMDECFEWVKAYSGFELKPILFPDGVGDDEARHQLSQTIVAQPALFSIEFALSRLLKSLDIEPNAMLGHSVSEYVAACLSGVYSPESAMRVICKRGQLVQSVPEGAMLAVRLSETEISPYIEGHLDLGSTLASDHCVVSGEPQAIAELEVRLEEEGIESKQVKVSRAYHSKMLDPILDEYRSFVAAVELQSPRIPFISCVTGDWITEEQARSPEYWVTQLRSPVRLHEGFQTLCQKEAVFLEVGCGTMLSSLAKALPELNERHRFVSTLPSSYQQVDDLTFMNQEIRRLTGFGIEVNDERLEACFPNPETSGSSNTQANDSTLSEMEKTISGFFRDVLGQTQIDKDENFLEAGGNSLMAMQLINRIREDLKVDLSLRNFFEHLTIASLSSFLETPGSNPQDQHKEVNESLDDSRIVKKDTTSKAMKLSVFFFSGDAEAQPEDRYKMVIDTAEFADKNGFDAIWIPERHFNKFGGLYPNPAIVGAAIAARTQHIHIRGGSVVAPLHHPVRIAEEWATLDNISKGRVGVSFGSGFHPKDFLLAPENFENRKQVMFDSIDTIRTLWKGENITATSGEGAPSTVQLFPSPYSESLPTWLSTTRSLETFAEAGQGGHHVLTALLRLSPNELRERIDHYRAARTNAGYHAADGRVTLMLHTFVGPDMDFVSSQVKEPLKDYLRSHMEHTQAVSQEKSGQSEEFLSSKDEEELLEHAYQRYFKESSLIGTVDSCLETISKLKAIGVDEIACLIDFGVSDDALAQGLKHLAQLQEKAKKL